MTTIGIIGAGLIGSQIARVAVSVGYDVAIANSRDPNTLADLVRELGPRARAVSATEAAAVGDFAIVAVPLKDYERIPVDQLRGKFVIDTSNYDLDRDGHIESLDNGRSTVTGLIQAHLPGSKVVKAFNLIGWQEITTDGAPKGSPARRALAVASDYPEAIEFITTLLDELGFDTVSTGDLSTSWRFDRNQPAYTIASQDVNELSAHLADATYNTDW